MYSLRRVSDDAGDSGPSSSLARLNAKTGNIQWAKRCRRPKLGWAMRVGSFRSWWTTTPVTEITFSSRNEVHFKTKNSAYVWKVLN